MTASSLPRTLILASVLTSAPLTVLAQAPAPVTGAAPVPPEIAAPAPAELEATAETASGSSFDSYRALAITTGVIGGAVVASVLTNGVILPLYCWATGSTAAGAGMGAAAAGAEAGLLAGSRMGGSGTWVFRNAMTALGAIGGGFYADSWYQNP